MTTRASEPIVSTAVAAWRDALAACKKMPTLVCAAGGVLFVLLFLNYVLAVHYVLPTYVGFLAKIVSPVARALFLTPLAIAIHRFVLLGEITNVYRIDAGNPRFQKFFLFALALLALAWLCTVPVVILAILDRLAQWRVAIFVTWTLVTSTLVIFAMN